MDNNKKTQNVEEKKTELEINNLKKNVRVKTNVKAGRANACW